MYTMYYVGVQDNSYLTLFVKLHVKSDLVVITDT